MLQTLQQVYQVSMELVLLNHVALELGRLVTPPQKKGGTNMDTLWWFLCWFYGDFMMIYGDFMVILWWFMVIYGDFMVILWWFKGV